jgi:GDP-D-mannose dehydratase
MESKDKAYNKFGWVPQTKFEDWVKAMVENDIKVLSK